MPAQGRQAGPRELLMGPWHPRLGLLRNGSDGVGGYIPALAWSA